MALQGYKSKSGFGGINYDYLSDLPKIEYGKNKVGEDFQYTSAPLSDGRGDDWGVDESSLNILANPFPDGMPGSPINNPEYKNQMGVPIVAGYETLPSTADEALDMMKQTVYNPATGKWEASTKSSYPGSTYMPGRFDTIDKTLLFGSPNADVSGMDMQGILDNAANSQALMAELLHNNPGAPLQQVVDSYHSHSTGFDVNTGEMLDPNISNQSFDQFHQQNVQNWQDNDQVHSGSVFDEGGIFSSSFWANKGGQVPGGK